jgi:hypothetical protein
VLRLMARAAQIYAAQILITMLAIAILALAATALDNPLLLEWNNAAAVFYDPILTHIGLVLITHQLGYFDILPLYVVLMAIAPVFAVIDRYAPHLLLPLSLVLYCAVLVFRIIPPTWPVEGDWFFNPLAWQITFVLGFTLARDDGVGGFARAHLTWIRIVATPIVVIGALMVWTGWFPDPTQVPAPILFFIADKTFDTPIRLIQFLAVVAIFSGTYPTIRRFAAPLTDFCSMLGRNSLPVFCVGSLLSLTGQIARFVSEGYVGFDTVVVVLGIAIMAATAWLAEWRDRVRSRPSVESPAAS